MSDERYPNGPFRSVGRALEPSERGALIQEIEDHPERLRAAVAGLTDAQLDTPYREGGWTVRQLVHHVADSHVNSYVRFRLAATEDAPRITTYDQDRWAELTDVAETPVETSLVLLEALHSRWVGFLRGLSDEDFARKLDHPEMGHIDIDFLLELYGWHGAHHEAHVTSLRAREGW